MSRINWPLIVMMICLTGVVAMIGAPWFSFSEPIALQILTLIGVIGSSAVQHYFRPRGESLGMLLENQLSEARSKP